jgi:hypothetical protein
MRFQVYGDSELYKEVAAERESKRNGYENITFEKTGLVILPGIPVSKNVPDAL